MTPRNHNVLITTAWSLGLMLFCAHATAQLSTENIGTKGFCFHGSGVVLPLNQFLLMRKGDDIGAIRLIEIKPDPSRPSTVGSWYGTVTYEAFFAHGLSQLPSAVGTTGQITFGSWRGFGFHYSWQSGNHRAMVGPWRLPFYSENGIFMTSVDFWNGIDHDSGLKFAGTAVSKVQDLVPNDPSLHWYGYDNNRDIPCPEPIAPGTKDQR